MPKVLWDTLYEFMPIIIFKDKFWTFLIVLNSVSMDQRLVKENVRPLQSKGNSSCEKEQVWSMYFTFATFLLNALIYFHNMFFKVWKWQIFYYQILLSMSLYRMDCTISNQPPIITAGKLMAHLYCTRLGYIDPSGLHAPPCLALPIVNTQEGVFLWALIFWPN